MESIEIMYSPFPDIIAIIIAILFVLLTLILSLYDYRYHPAYSFRSYIILILIICTYSCFRLIINPQILDKWILEDTKDVIMPVWNEWVENKEVVDSPIKNIEIDGYYLEITLFSGDIYYMPFTKGKKKRVLIFKHYPSKRIVQKSKHKPNESIDYGSNTPL